MTQLGFLKHPIDGGTEKLLLHSTLGDLVVKCKGLSLGVKLWQLSLAILSTSNSEKVSNFGLWLTTPSESNRIYFNKSNKISIRKQNPNHFHVSEVKHASMLMIITCYGLVDLPANARYWYISTTISFCQRMIRM